MGSWDFIVSFRPFGFRDGILVGRASVRNGLHKASIQHGAIKKSPPFSAEVEVTERGLSKKKSYRERFTSKKQKLQREAAMEDVGGQSDATKEAMERFQTKRRLGTGPRCGILKFPQN